jgi:cellulose synthase/poly-beta-1,6-N-acetylglucosamine synthase-like glycosyltransferase
MILVILAILALLYLLIDLWLIRGLSRLNSKNTPKKQDPKVSILISARDEEDFIEACLTPLLDQDYSKDLYEIWVTDDRSSDKTLEILKKLQAQHPILNILESPEIPKGVSPKKNALIHMLQKATGDFILTTDADCIAPKTWISSTLEAFKDETHMVVGFSSFKPDEKISTHFYKLQALEFLTHFVVSAGAIGNGLPITSSGNNLAYKKSSYLEFGGFEGLENIISGDDDLLLHRFAQASKDGVRFNTNSKSFVETFAQPDFNSLWNQRKRWASKTVYYPPMVTVVLSIVFFFYFSTGLSLLAFLWNDLELFKFGLIAFCIKTLMDFWVISKGASILNKSNLMPYFWPTALVQIPLIVGAVLFGVFGKFNWKNRTSGK